MGGTTGLSMKEKGKSLGTAAALLVLSPMARAIGNFFMGLNKAVIPTRIFTSEPLAIEWLQPYLP